MLSFVAGMVNICGVLGVGTLTTNVTGHFAFFAEELSFARYAAALTFLAFILSFLAGAFSASFFSELVSLRKPDYAHLLPMLLEIFSLVWVIVTFEKETTDGTLVACVLLFAMGMQNSLVTSVSSAVVRTTHLTGLFTDLGIELSQLIFYRSYSDQHKLRRSVFLRSSIILCFFAGGISGGYLFASRGMHALQLAVIILVVALFYDNIRYRLFALRRKIKR